MTGPNFVKKNQKNWDERIPLVFWAYITKNQKWTKQTPFQLVYEWEEVIPT